MALNALRYTPKFKKPILGIAGGGVFFFWEIGVLKYLNENYRLRDVDLIGVSAGALCAVLVASGVSLDRAVRKAYDISVEADIWNRSGGLAGIWGDLIRRWLEELLPEDAHECCQNRVKIIATRMPRMQLRDEQYIDGSVWDFFSGSNSGLLTLDGQSCIIDYFLDDQLEFNRLDFIKILTFDTVLDLVKSGYSYAERTDARGLYAEKLGGVRKQALWRLLESVPRKAGDLLGFLQSDGQ
eukprot:jgi/Picre1/34769/NNA_002235.t1